jgi:indolepyruvate ferredoxin oxidoreductase, alpha subunit
MERILVLGAEAAAIGGIDAGISGVYAYPGTPSTEITEYIQKSAEAKMMNIRSSWSVNEKTAYEAALGMSYSGKRAMVCMKHVGLNVASDAFINSAITGVNGGLILTVADDPSMHSSQNEQDSRYYGKFSMIPVLEPSSQQEIYDAVIYGFELSERIKLPVMLRITTRLSHSRSGIIRKKTKTQNSLQPPENSKNFILLPGNAKIQYKHLLGLQSELEKISSKSEMNRYLAGSDRSLGIIACGISFNYIMEIKQGEDLEFPILKIGQYPFPDKLVRKIFYDCKEILVLEEGYPIYEELLRGFFDNEQIKGRLDGTLPRDGELNPDIVREALNGKKTKDKSVSDILVNRPPQLCQGCSHIDLYEALNEALKPYEKKHVFSDIGCYTLGALPPFNSINTCIDMGASITMAKGAADAGIRPAISVIGDSTFTHSGITGLLDAVNDKTPITVIISDNYTTAMTGGQNSAATGRLYQICKGIGVEEDHILIMEPLKINRTENVKVIRQELSYEGVSVIIANRECIQTLTRKKRISKK